MDPLRRFRMDLLRVLPEGATSEQPLALAVSGGPDSMAMLWLSAQALPGAVTAATVDHGLRNEAAAEAELVAATCVTLGVSHSTLRPPVPICAGNIASSARAVRYALLESSAASSGAVALATAHQFDDQAETFLMRAVRGCGTAGLAGVRERRHGGELAIIRPLLRWKRSELADLVAQAQLSSATDPSNDDERFERARVRRLLRERPEIDALGLANAAKHVGEAEAALASMVDWLWRERVQHAGDSLSLDVQHLPREPRRRLVRRALALRLGNDRQTRATEPLLDALEAGRACTQADVLVTPRGELWKFSDAPPRRRPNTSRV